MPEKPCADPNCPPSTEAQDPMIKEFIFYVRALLHTPPPRAMLWGIVQVMKDSVAVASVLEEHRRQEWRE